MAEIYWANAVNGGFNDAADWTGGVVPGASDHAILDAAGADFKVGISTSVTVNSIQTAANAALNIGGGTFTALNGTGLGANYGMINLVGGDLAIGGTFDNAGGVDLNALDHIVIGSTGATLTGGGTIEGVQSVDGIISGGSLTNVDNLLTGNIAIQTDGFVNDSAGTVEATGTTNSSEIFSIPGNVINQGLIEADDALGFSIVTKTLQNTGGVIRAENGSAVGLNSTYDLIGGTLISTGSGVFLAGTDNEVPPRIFDGRSSPLYVQATVLVENGERLAIEGAIDNQGAFAIQADFFYKFGYFGQSVPGYDYPTMLEVGRGGATLTGGGDITLDDRPKNYVRSDASTAQTLENVDNTISGAGSLGLGTISLENETAGVIDASDSYALVIDTGVNAFYNAGLIEATGTGGLVLKSSTVENASTILIGTGSRLTLQGSEIQGGVLAASGDGIIRVDGADNTIDGSSSPVAIDGELIVLAGASLAGEGAIDLSGKLVDKGVATLNGSLTYTGPIVILDGTLTVTGALAGSGAVVINNSTFSFDSAFDQTIEFQAPGVVVMGDSEAFTGTIAGMTNSGSTLLDLKDIGFVDADEATYSGTASGGVLTVTDGAHTAEINLQGDYLSNTFTTKSDGSGGVIVSVYTAFPPLRINLATGQDPTGAIQTAGDLPDANWKVSNFVHHEPGSVAYTVGPGDEDWPSGADLIPNGPDSSWICADPNVIDNGTEVTYTLRFDLTGYNPNYAYISGGQTTQDGSLNAITLNGHQIGPSTSPFSFVPICNGFGDFVAGWNTLVIQTSDEFDPNGYNLVRLEGVVVDPVPAGPEQWLNPVTGSFTTPSDWSGGIVPEATDDLVLDAAGADYTVASRINETVNSLQTAANATLAIAGGTFTVDNGVDGAEGDGVIAGALVVDAAGNLVIDGPVNLTGKIVTRGIATLNGALTNNGELETVNGSLTVGGAVTGTGDAVIDGGTMTFGSSFSQKVVFDGAGALVLADSQGYAGTVWKFSSSGTDSMDLEDIALGTGTTAAYSGTASGGVLTVTDGTQTATIAMKGDYLGSTFTLSEDANGGTIVTDKVDTPAITTFAQAIAGFAPTPTASAGVMRLAEHNAPVMLSRPGTSVA